MKSQARGMQFHLKILRHRGFRKKFVKSLLELIQKTPVNGCFYISFFDNLDETNTYPDEIDTKHPPRVSFKLLTKYLRLY